MILADKIIELRKRAGMSQEELAEKLDVSRQSVSKWESAQSMPDLNRILKIAEIFSVSTDMLLKDEIDLNQIENPTNPEVITAHDDMVPPARRVTMLEANEFIDKIKIHSVRKSLGIAVIIFSVMMPVIFEILSMGSSLAENIGVVFMFLLIAAGVGLIIYSGMLMKPFDFLSHERIETEYGVDGIVKEKQSRYQVKHALSIVIGISMIILSPILPIIFDAIPSDFHNLDELGAVFMFIFISAGVYSIVHTEIINNAYKTLLDNKEFSREKAKDHMLAKVMSVYWLMVTAVYLGYSFISYDWGRSWIIWPIAAVLCPIVGIVTSSIKKKS